MTNKKKRKQSLKGCDICEGRPISRYGIQALCRKHHKTLTN